MKARFVRKAADKAQWTAEAENYNEVEFEVVKPITLSPAEFDGLADNLLTDRSYIAENNGRAESGDTALKVLAIRAEGRDEVILTDPSGYGYARYTAFVKAEEIDRKPADDSGMRKLTVIYRMEKPNETAESCVTLPISEARYAELAKGLTPNNKAWNEIQHALESLTCLQGYDKLGSWSLELEIKTED
jgi:hypothetical protein